MSSATSSLTKAITMNTTATIIVLTFLISPLKFCVRYFVCVSSPFWWIILCMVVQIVVVQSSEFISSRLKVQHNFTNIINECNSVLFSVSHPLIYLIIMTYFDGLSHNGFIETIEVEKNTFMWTIFGIYLHPHK